MSKGDVNVDMQDQLMDAGAFNDPDYTDYLDELERMYWDARAAVWALGEGEEVTF